jgi:hypothetical protein
MKKISDKLRKHKMHGPDDGIEGVYVFRHPKQTGIYFQVVASDGYGWEHVSVVLRAVDNGTFIQRCPTWAEMCYIKDLFWEDNETAVQYHPAKSEYVNVHPYCLHLWRSTREPIPVPDSILVG